MDSSSSSSTLNIRGRSRVVPKEIHHNSSSSSNLKPPGPVLKHHILGRCPSHSYSTTPADEASLLSAPSTPQRLSGVPFSWEKTPGIPKRQSSSWRKDKESAAASATALLGRSLLPLPPSATPPTSRRFTAAHEASFRKKALFPGGTVPQYQLDPFTAALAACSKEEGHGNNCKVNNNDRSNGSNLLIGRRRMYRTTIDRFGSIAFYGSCKRATPISESVIYLPRPSPSPYMVTNGRSH